MDAYSDYNQIRVHELDQENTTFINNRGLYCYKVLPFRLKNIGPVYRRLVNTIFVRQIGHTMKVYIYDKLMKSLNPKDHVNDL